MKKRYILFLAAILLLAFLVPQAIAAVNDAQKAKLTDLETKILELRKQQVDVYTEAGEITKEEAADIKSRIDTNFKNRIDNGNYGCGIRSGGGCNGGGCRGGGGWGVGAGGVGNTVNSNL